MQVNMDVKRYDITEIQNCISIDVLTCCCKSVLTYRIAVGMLYFSVDVTNYRCDDVQKYGLTDLLMQRSKSMSIKRFTQINHYFFTYLKNCINE